ncbi:glycosyltransferase family 2 protein [Rosettibacter firmus]|uniref:glycosyltransferase family 2 protein n=1 Tax=Rosettibacter firmus TaxID=3111522 RepID=UPI00336C27D7
MKENQKSDSQNSHSQTGKKQRRFFYRKKVKPIQAYQEFREVQNFSFKKVSIVIPLYNEEESIKPLYNDLKKSLKNISCEHEIIFVDDGSTDKSLNIIKELARYDNRVHYLSFRTNYGKSAALQMGFKHCTGDVIITMDADLQDDPEEIPNLLRKLEEGYDLVSGWKKKRYDPFIKKYSSRFFNFVTRFLSKVKIHDFNCGLKAYRRAVVQSINVYGELHRYIPVLAGWKGFTVSEIVVKHHPRRYGKTKFGISRFFKGFLDLITVIFTIRFIKRPMHLFGIAGLLFTILGTFISLWLTYEKLFFGRGINNRPIFFLGILLIIVGIQFFAIGLLGELFVHNFQSDKEYVIKEKK